MKQVAFSQPRLVGSSRGFSLIELMVVVAVVAILASIAYPSYQDSVRRTRRADARTVLLEAAQFMERNYTEANRYDKFSNDVITELPAGLRKSPRDGAAIYNVSISASAANTFTLSAVPVGVMAGDACGTLTLTNTGARGASGSLGATECWAR